MPITRMGGFGIYTDFSTQQEKGDSACRQDFLAGVLNKAFLKAWSVYSLSSCVLLLYRLAKPLRVLLVSHLHVSKDDSDLRADILPKNLKLFKQETKHLFSPVFITGTFQFIYFSCRSCHVVCFHFTESDQLVANNKQGLNKTEGQILHSGLPNLGVCLFHL